MRLVPDSPRLLCCWVRCSSREQRGWLPLRVPDRKGRGVWGSPVSLFLSPLLLPSTQVCTLCLGSPILTDSQEQEKNNKLFGAPEKPGPFSLRASDTHERLKFDRESLENSHVTCGLTRSSISLSRRTTRTKVKRDNQKDVFYF